MGHQSRTNAETPVKLGTLFIRVPLTIALVYALAGFLWIMFSDMLLEKLVPYQPLYHTLQTFKGWFYVIVTAAILFVVLKAVYHHILTAYQQATQSEHRLALALTCANGGIWDRDLSKVGGLYISPKLKEMVGLPVDQPVKLGEWRTRVHPLDWPAVEASVTAAIATRGERTHDVHYRFRAVNGEYLRLHSRGQVLCDSDGNPTRLVGIIVDETAQTLAAERIDQLMAYDSLTGLANRSTFITQLDDLLKQHDNGNKRVAVAQILIHDFNELFDEYGNAFTNEMIQVLGKKLTRFAEPDGLTSRLEHDCFAIAVPHRSHTDKLQKAIKYIANLLDRPIAVGEREVRLSYSIGVAVSPQDGNSANMLIANSRRALSKHGSAGRDAVHWFTEGMDVELRQRIQRLRDLRKAVDNGDIHCHYQPIVDLKSGTTIGFEALARWHRPGEGMVPPDRFIQLAEETGHIRALGEQILRKACQQAVQWERKDGSAPFVAVNVSPRQIDDPQFPALVRDVLAEYGLPAERLELEVTEAAMAQDTDAARERLQTLRELGVSLALDDFGTGYSSLSNLSNLPFTRLKVDRAFTREYGRNVRSTEIANAILVLSRALGLNVTVEGVETLLQSSTLRAVGVKAAQGFYFSRAVAAKDVRDLLDRNWTPIIEDEPQSKAGPIGLKA